MAAPLAQALAEDQAVSPMRSRYCTAGACSTWMEACHGACSHVVHVRWAACRRWGGGTPCLPSGRSTCPCRPGRWPRSGRSAPPTRWCLPGGACRRRAPAGSPSAGRPHAGCRSACGRGRTCCARTLPTAATRPRAWSASRLRLALCPSSRDCIRLMRPPAWFAACAHRPARRRAPRRRRPTPSDARARRSRLHGPSPAITRQNSSQSMAPKSWCCALLVPLQIGVGQRDAEHLGLLDGGVDERLAQRRRC